MLLFRQIPPFSPVLVASVMLCAVWSLNLVSPLEAWSIRPVLHKDSCLLRFFYRLFNRYQPAISMADQPNVLPDPPAPAGVQQGAEPVQTPPQALEPIAEPAPALGPADEVHLFFLVHFV